MKRKVKSLKPVNLIFSSIYILLLFLWITKIHKYYFDMDAADWSGVIITAFAAIILSIKIKKTVLPQWLIFLMTAVLPLIIFPLISELILRFNTTWSWLYLTLGISTFLILRVANWKLLSVPLIAVVICWVLPYQFLPGQQYYYERLIMEEETREGTIHLVQWKDDYWLHYNRQLQYSTIDGHMYGEAWVHPAMSLLKENAKVLIIGGDNGQVKNELYKYPEIDLSIIPYDLDFARFIEDQKWINLNIPASQIIEKDPFQFLINTNHSYDLIIIDLPEPTTAALNQFYSIEFYRLAYQALTDSGHIVTQAGNPILNKNSLQTIDKTLHISGFHTTRYHAQIPTIGQWSWVLGSKQKVEIQPEKLIANTRWLNAEAMRMMLSFGKMEYFTGSMDSINTIKKPVLLNAKAARL